MKKISSLVESITLTGELFSINPYLRFCTIVLTALWLSLSCFYAHAADNSPLPVTMHEGLSKELEDSLIKAEKEGRLIDYYIEKESQFRDQGKYGEIINMSNWVEKRLRNDDVHNLLLVYEVRSPAYLNIGDYESMFGDIEKSLDIPKNENLQFRNAMLYMVLMDFNLKNDHLNLAQQYLDKAKSIASAHKDSDINVDAWKNLNYSIHLIQGQFYRFQDNWKAANEEYEKAKKYIISERHIHGLNVQKFFFYIGKGEYESADSIYHEKFEQNNQVTFAELGNIRMAHICLLLEVGDMEKAKEELNNINPNCIPILDRPILYALSSNLYETEGNYEQAYYYLNKHVYLRDSLDAEYKRVYAQQAADRFEMRQTQKFLEKERLQNLHNIIFITILGIALITTSILVILVVGRHRNRKRDQLIAEKNLGNRNAALSSAVMMADNYKNVCEDIKSILSLNVEAEQKIAEINKRLKESSNVVEPLHQVSNTNDETIREFMDKLRYVHPDLTNAELRMAQLIFMNISNKDIAEMQNRSLGTIKNQKYSLRKKLATEMPMEQYLKQLSAASPSELEELAKKK